MNGAEHQAILVVDVICAKKDPRNRVAKLAWESFKEILSRSQLNTTSD
jgi:hypothetical protein